MVGQGLEDQLSSGPGDSVMDELIEHALTQVPGLVLGLSIGGVREVSAHGSRQVLGVDSPLAMSPQASFDLGSITKILATTAGFMRLIDAGALTLDDQVRKFLPEWNGTEKDQITVRDLLLHRGGLWEWRPLYIHSQDPEVAVQLIAQIPLRYPVNDGRHYSDLGFISLGRILSKVAGQDLNQSVVDLVLQPLQLVSTQFAAPIAHAPVAATSMGDSIEKEMVISKVPYPVPEDARDFENWREQLLVGEVNDGNAFHVFNGTSGHAGLFSTADDLLAFGEAINASFREGGPYSKEIAHEFLKNGPDLGQQLGFRSWTNTYQGSACQFFGHTGFPGTVLAFSPSHDCVIVLMTNRLHVEGLPVATELLWQPFISSIHKKLHSS